MGKNHALRLLRRSSVGLVLAFFSLPLWGQGLDLLLETNTNSGAGEELFHASYGDLAGLLAGAETTTSFSQVNVGTSFSVRGYTSSGQGVHILLESDMDAGAGDELFLASYDGLADFLAGAASSTMASQIDVGSDFSVAGLSFRGEEVHLLLESELNAPGGAELFHASYGSLAAFLAGIEASTSFSQVNVGSGFGVQGFSFQGESVHVLFETDSNAGAGEELFLASYDSLADFLAGVLSEGSFSQVNVGATFGVAGLMATAVGIFSDGFESGDTLAWSAAVP